MPRACVPMGVSLSLSGFVAIPAELLIESSVLRQTSAQKKIIGALVSCVDHVVSTDLYKAKLGNRRNQCNGTDLATTAKLALLSVNLTCIYLEASLRGRNLTLDDRHRYNKPVRR